MGWVSLVQSASLHYHKYIPDGLWARSPLALSYRFLPIDISWCRSHTISQPVSSRFGTILTSDLYLSLIGQQTRDTFEMEGRCRHQHHRVVTGRYKRHGCTVQVETNVVRGPVPDRPQNAVFVRNWMCRGDASRRGTVGDKSSGLFSWRYRCLLAKLSLEFCDVLLELAVLCAQGV